MKRNFVLIEWEDEEGWERRWGWNEDGDEDEEMRCDAMRWDEMRWDEMRWDEIRWEERREKKRREEKWEEGRWEEEKEKKKKRRKRKQKTKESRRDRGLFPLQPPASTFCTTKKEVLSTTQRKNEQHSAHKKHRNQQPTYSRYWISTGISWCLCNKMLY